MSKYGPLWKYLQAGGTGSVRMTFSEIEQVLGFGIDHSFLTCKKELLQFGYSVGKISLKEKYITFNKIA